MEVPAKFKQFVGQNVCLRLWDMFDGWIDILTDVPFEEAFKRWAEETADGTKMTEYSHGDYWNIFPAGTQMLVTPEYLGR